MATVLTQMTRSQWETQLLASAIEPLPCRECDMDLRERHAAAVAYDEARFACPRCSASHHP